MRLLMQPSPNSSPVFFGSATRGVISIASGLVPKIAKTLRIVGEEGGRTLLVPVSDATLGEIIGRHLEGDAVPG